MLAASPACSPHCTRSGRTRIFSRGSCHAQQDTRQLLHVARGPERRPSGLLLLLADRHLSRPDLGRSQRECKLDANGRTAGGAGPWCCGAELRCLDDITCRSARTNCCSPDIAALLLDLPHGFKVGGPIEGVPARATSNVVVVVNSKARPNSVAFPLR